MNATLWQVFLVAVVTDLACGLGAVPFAFTKQMSARWQGLSYAFAGGMMISAATFSLAAQGMERGAAAWQIVIGLLAGAAFFWWTAERLGDNKWQIGDLSVEESRKSVLLIVTMTIHSIPEGLAIGVGYATGELKFGLLLAMAIAIHNIPEGIAVSLPLKAKGVSTWKCFWYATLTSVPQPLFAVPAYLFFEHFHLLLPVGLGFAGGAMIYLVIAEMIPECSSLCSKHETAWGFMLGLVVMMLFTAGIGL
jgi:zinc transporter, ZIP family